MIPMVDVKFVSFGFGHDTPPEADIVVDVRDWFRDPHIDPALRALTGRDEAVVQKVMSTHGVRGFVDRLRWLTDVLVIQGGRAPVVAIGCVGGRHRSVVIADAVAKYFGNRYEVEVTHRDIDKPVLARKTEESR